MIKKKPFTLIEVLIATTLTSVMLYMLLSIYSQCQKIDRQNSQTRQLSYEMQMLASKLSSIIPFTYYDHGKPNHYFFFTSNEPYNPNSQSLVFCFNNGSQYDKPFSSDVIARLYLDEQRHLALAIWPHKASWKEGSLPIAKKQILLEEVEELSFEFFATPPKEFSSIESLGQGVPDTTENLISEWKKEYQTTPATVHIHITKNGETKTLSYAIIRRPQPIIYQKDH